MPSSTTNKNAPPATQSKRPIKKARIEEKVPSHSSKKTKPLSRATVSTLANGKGKGKARAPTPPASLPSTLLKNEVDSSKPSPLPRTFKIVAGTYEKLLYGLEGTVSAPSTSSKEATFSLKPIFIFPAHVSCVKAVAASPEGGKWLATGSADEIIKVWDLRRRREIGGLMHHNGAPPSLLHMNYRSYLSSKLVLVRFYNPSFFSFSLTSPIRVRRRHTLYLSREGLGCPSFAEGPQGPYQLYRCTSFRKSWTQCREG